MDRSRIISKINSVNFLVAIYFVSCLAFEVMGVRGSRPGDVFYPFFVRVKVNWPSHTCGGALVAADIVAATACYFLDEDWDRWVDKEEVRVFKSNLNLQSCAKNVCYFCEVYNKKQ